MDLLQDLVAKLYVCDQPVKPTPRECAQLLGQVGAVVVIDDLRASADQFVISLRYCRAAAW